MASRKASHSSCNLLPDNLRKLSEYWYLNALEPVHVGMLGTVDGSVVGDPLALVVAGYPLA